ncbi:MAG: hypothetical protein V4684_17990 [Pseudomonadota bacterium]
MPTTPPINPASAIPVPRIDIDEPVAVIPIASVAPLDGPPDGERINTFALAPRTGESAFEESMINAFGSVRASVLSRPLTYVAAAFSLGFAISRLRR